MDASYKNKDGARVLMLSSAASMIDQFNMSNIELLQEMGYQVDVACNFERGNPCSDERIEYLKQRFDAMGVDYYQIDFTRSVMNLSQNFKAYTQVRRLTAEKNYAFIHCHSPIGGVVGRIVARILKTRIIYTAHGFHFFSGAPKKNWLLFYPIEKFFSRWTDILVTINQEDYNMAKSRLHAKKVFYIPGVGVDIKKYSVCNSDEKAKRKELHVPQNAFLLFATRGWKNKEKLRIMLEALHCLKNEDIYYIFTGQGKMDQEFESLIENYGLKKNVRFLGDATDIDELCEAADCFIQNSDSNEFNIDELEAMASGLPVISISDSVEEMVAAIKELHENSNLRNEYGGNNLRKARMFELEKSPEIMNELNRIGGGNYRHTKCLDIRSHKRKEFGFALDDFVVISIGELNQNKNHKTIIKAIRKLNNPRVKYIICGRGIERENLLKLIQESNLEEQVFLAGFQTDVKEFLYMADLFAFPSKREGLGLAAIEAMAAGLPLLTSNVHGIKDYSINGKSGYSNAPSDVSGFVDSLEKCIQDKKQMVDYMRYNRIECKKYDIADVKKKMKDIYSFFATAKMGR